MAEFVFTSAGVKFKERDLTFVTRNVGITTLGLVGETLKGPAFEPVFVQDQTQFANRFGGQSIKRFANGNLQYQLPYVANSYLQESNQLWITRVLGLSGYDAGKAWALTLNAGVKPSTVASGATTTFTGVTFTNNTYLGVTLNNTGDTGVSFSGFTKINDSGFTGISHSFTVYAYSGSTGSGKVSGTSTTFTASEYTDYKNMVLAVVRSRGNTVDNVNLPTSMKWETTTVTLPSTGNTTLLGIGDMFGQFKLVATSGTTVTNYIASLNPDSSSFLPNVIGSEPNDKTTKIWVEATYPDLIKKLDSDGEVFDIKWEKFGIAGVSPYGFGVNDELIVCDTNLFTNYKTQFKTPETPWIVSEIKGNSVSRLFKFISISDGNTANQEIKVTIQNINPIALEFDVIIRNFYDTDDNVSTLESFTRCSLIKGQNNYIGQRIGTKDGEYDLQSKYITVEVAPDINITDFPAGFEGYLFNNFAVSATTSGSTVGVIEGITPKIFYKRAYADDERIKRIYLGISENAYNTANVVGTGINQNFFNFNGLETTTKVKTNGFHMDKYASGITSNGYSFDYGADVFQTISNVTDPLNAYYDINTRKFTLVPAGGFDGWDVYRFVRSYGDLYRLNGIYDGVVPNGQPTNDFQAWETAINTFANPEEVTINVFATPAINWSDQNILVQDTIEMIEQQRTDTLYVIDCPDVTIPTTVGDGGKADVQASQDIADLLDTAGIDSSYACTYFPWIQMRDTQNNVNIYIPPTGEVVKALAYTDNTSFPWFAPAGLNRGVTNARKSKYKLSLEARDTLYAGRINPMADFADTGTAIFGQKTLQVKESALDRINVRRLLLQIKVLIANIAIRLVFEQNDQATIDQFLSKATPILDTIKRERGLYDFRIKMDDSNNTVETRDRNELYGEIFLKPTRALEFIGITFTITPSGASFADVGA
jgi:hypothetical protein